MIQESFEQGKQDMQAKINTWIEMGLCEQELFDQMKQEREYVTFFVSVHAQMKEIAAQARDLGQLHVLLENLEELL